MFICIKIVKNWCECLWHVFQRSVYVCCTLLMNLFYPVEGDWRILHVEEIRTPHQVPPGDQMAGEWHARQVACMWERREM